MDLREKVKEALQVLVAAPETTSYDKTADAILAIPEIAEALDWWQMNLDAQRRALEEEEEGEGWAAIVSNDGTVTRL